MALISKTARTVPGSSATSPVPSANRHSSRRNSLNWRNVGPLNKPSRHAQLAVVLKNYLTAKKNIKENVTPFAINIKQPYRFQVQPVPFFNQGSQGTTRHCKKSHPLEVLLVSSQPGVPGQDDPSGPFHRH